ncbi:hypothetical protein CIL05_06775 [Virgibacillus profundi]|uniref:Uncharacterized protein n=1 Tax=Virgibacillus profundi TaxID=2024555 RepID=A0A2A2IGA8_9BACI|nr:hypothetical protein [Virgibacillus profundi]PAV30165.1 hypothetical protein CIL05_06775 [Virgibacillus profundi]PXY54337.1 hypothetical protein CIT14_06860 [Virgibacillus profundi]
MSEDNKQVKTTKQPTPKKLTMAKVKRTAKEVNTMSSYELNEDVAIKFYPTFPESKIHELLQEVQNILNYLNEIGEDITDDELGQHVFLLTIKHFTDLKPQISDKFEEQLQQMSQLIDAGYYKQILNEVFSQSEIDKVAKAMAELRSRYEFLASIEDNTKENLKVLELKNQEMFNTLSKEAIRSRVNNNIQ